jgi:hypothetical protein
MDMICSIHARPVRTSSSITNIAASCLLKYRLMIFMYQSIKPGGATVKQRLIFLRQGTRNKEQERGKAQCSCTLFLFLAPESINFEKIN